MSQPEIPKCLIPVWIQGNVLPGEGVAAVVAQPDVVAGVGKNVA